LPNIAPEVFMRVRIGSALMTVALATILWPSTASAQDRRGAWFGIGAGYGSTGASCEEGCEDREDGGAGYLKGGFTVTPRLLIGAEVNIWAKEQENITFTLYNVSGTVTFYPSATRGFFLKGGAGGAFADAEAKDGSLTVNLDLGRGPGVIAGAGYDIRLGRRVALTPAVNVWYGRIGDLKVIDETVLSDFRFNVVDVTIGITFP
jgi:hypothetical protein